VIAGTAIAAPGAANKPGANSAAAPTDGTSKVPKGASIIGTANGNTGGAAGKSKRA